MGGALIFSLSMSITSCEDVLGEWSRPTPNPVTPTVNPDVTPEPPIDLVATPLTVEALTDGTIMVTSPHSRLVKLGSR